MRYISSLEKYSYDICQFVIFYKQRKNVRHLVFPGFVCKVIDHVVVTAWYTSAQDISLVPEHFSSVHLIIHQITIIIEPSPDIILTHLKMFFRLLISLVVFCGAVSADYLRVEATTCVCTTVPCPVSGANYLNAGTVPAHIFLRISLFILSIFE